MTSILVNSGTRDASDPDRSLPAQGPYRTLYETADTFARESQIDELAYSAGIDPVDFRLGLRGGRRYGAAVLDYRHLTSA